MVVVYRNQAEVHRVVTLASEEVAAGHHDIVVSGKQNIAEISSGNVPRTAEERRLNGAD